MPPVWYSGISGIVGISISKRAVEYTFVPHPTSKPCRLILYQDHLQMICGREEKIIPYGEVVRVQMEKRRGIYITQLECRKLSTVTIANHSFLPDGKTENQARQYTLFIRLLHYHLVTKSRAEFSTSTNFRESKRWLFMIVSVTVILALVIDYWNWQLDYITLLLLGVAILTPAVVMVWLGRLPQPYQPSEIPLDFLP